MISIIKPYLASNTSAAALKAVNELDELLETAFGNRERKVVSSIIEEGKSVVNRGGWGRGVPKSTHDAPEIPTLDQNINHTQDNQTYIPLNRRLKLCQDNKSN
jgi:hypothetical protein